MNSSNKQSNQEFEPWRIDRKNYSEIAKIITLIQNNSDMHCSSIGQFDLGEIKSLTIGITGAAGVGKSTFINKFTEIAIQDDKHVAILAIDPTSKYSLGTFLGDRLCFNADFPEAGVFIRSIASSIEISSVPANLDIIVKFLKIVGYNLIIVETLGVGQSDVEIKNYVDCVIVIPSYESNNWRQQFKLSMHDIADFYFVNKRDTATANATYNSLKNYLSIKSGNYVFDEFIIKGSAKSGQGIKEIYTRIIMNTESISDE